MADSPAPQSLAGRWLRFDATLYAAESWFTVAATAVMTGVVFLAVVWRLFAAPEGKLALWVQRFAGTEAEWTITAANGISLALWVLLCVFAVRTARSDWAWPKALGFGLLYGIGFIIAARLLVWMLPEGIIFSQRLALSLMMWVVLLGSSMAAYTRRHIFVQAAQKLVPEELLPIHGALVHFIAATFVGFLAWHGTAYAAGNLRDWWNSDLTRGIFESIPIPYWAVTIAIPIGFLLTLVRFAAQGVLILKGVIPPVPVNEDIEAAEGVQLQEGDS